MDDKTQKLVFAGLVVALLAAIVGAIVWGQADSDPETTSEPGTQAHQNWLGSWSTENATQLQIAWSETEGPSLRVAEDEARLAPSGLSWSVESRDGATFLTGLDDAGTRASWQFSTGNPTAVFRVQKTISTAELADPVEVTLELPAGQLEAWGARAGFHQVDAYHAEGAGAPWVRWSNDESSLTFRGWNGDAIDAEPSEDGRIRARFSLWSPEQHPSVVECLGEFEASDVTFDARVLVEFRELPKLVAWPYPDGSEAMMLPIFLAPELHSDPQLGEAKARNAGDFVDRVTTLAYGHSSPKDPRYGNGGILGHGLGGTVVAPKRLLAKKKVRKLARDMEPTRMDIAAGARRPEKSPYDVRYAEELNCETLQTPELLGLVSPRRDEPAQTARTAPSPFTTHISTRMLDGRLESLIAQGFSRAYAEQALRDRSIYAFASPMVATRNPLIGAAADAVLEPERKGMWTVSPRLAGSLADVELWREARPIGVSSVNDLLGYWHFSDRSALLWGQNGAPRIAGPDEYSQVGYTIAIDGEAKLPEALSPPPKIRVVDTDNGPVTLLSWDVAPDTSSLALQRDLTSAAVTWDISQN